MGVLDKVMFWKKNDDFADLGLASEDSMEPLAQEQSDINQDMNLGPTGGFSQQDLGFDPNQKQGREFNSQQNYAQYPQDNPYSNQNNMRQGQNMGSQFSQDSSHSDMMMTKNMEIISSKLDALRASLESMNQRLANLERLAASENYNKNERNW